MLAIWTALLASTVLSDTPMSVATAEIVVVVDSSLTFDPPGCGDCMVFDVSRPTSLPRPARAAIITGHSDYQNYLGLFPEDLAWTLSALAERLEWIIFDTCLGAQLDLIRALDTRGPPFGFAVATTHPIPGSGLEYGRAFEDGLVTAAEIAAIGCCRDRSRALTRWKQGASRGLDHLERLAARRARLCELANSRRRVLPNLYAVSPDQPSPAVDGPVLVHVPTAVVRDAQCGGD